MKEVLDYDILGAQDPQYSQKKQIAFKVTSGPFTKMPKTNIPPKEGFHEVRPSKQKKVKTATCTQNDDE